MKMPAVSAFAAVLVALTWYGLSQYQYPNQRVCHWFEFFTDGWAPDILAEDCRRVLAAMWRRVFEGGHVEDSGLLDALLSEIGVVDSVTILELAAGTGVAAGLWHELLRHRGRLHVRTVLTDLQPMVPSWQRIEREFPKSSISYIPDSVDATDASAILAKYFPDWSSATTAQDNTTVAATNKEVRMIHLALHHFHPHLVKSIFQDAVKANAMIVVGDLVPSLPNIFFQSQWGFHEFLKLTPSLLLENPVKILLAALTPLLIFTSYHDAAVSVLRAYSFRQLQDILEECTKDYKVRTFQMFTFADSLGLSQGTIPLFDSPHVQFFVASPN